MSLSSVAVTHVMLAASHNNVAICAKQLTVCHAGSCLDPPHWKLPGTRFEKPYSQRLKKKRALYGR